MQKTFCSITFRDANNFSKMAKKVQRLEAAPQSRRDFNKLYSAKTNLYEFSKKLVNKAVPNVFAHHQKCAFLGLPAGADKVQLTANDYENIAMKVFNVSDAHHVKSYINHFYEYKNSEDAKFSLKGQTFSSIVEYFVTHSHAIMNYQGRIAGAIFNEIRENINKLIKERVQPTSSDEATA